jgi:cytochrome b6-f complex iron-sulfur subunit
MNDRPGRRRFLNWFLGTSIGALLAWIAYPLIRFLTPPELPESPTRTVEAGTTQDSVLLDKNFKIIRFGQDPVIVVRRSETDVRAFSAVCTHLQCIVTYRKEKELIWCYCHNGVYDLNGKNIAGPPPRPLAPFKVDIASGGASKPGTIVVSKT